MNEEQKQERNRGYFGRVVGVALGLLIASLFVLYDPLKIDSPDNLFGGFMFLFVYVAGLVFGGVVGRRVGISKKFSAPPVYVSLLLVLVLWLPAVFGPAKLEKLKFQNLAESFQIYPGSELAWSNIRSVGAQRGVSSTLSISWLKASEKNIFDFYTDQYNKNGWKVEMITKHYGDATTPKQFDVFHLEARKGNLYSTVHVRCGGRPSGGGVATGDCPDSATYPYQDAIFRVIHFGISDTDR